MYWNYINSLLARVIFLKLLYETISEGLNLVFILCIVQGLVPSEARRGHLLKLELETVVSRHVGVGIKPESSKEQSVLQPYHTAL